MKQDELIMQMQKYYAQHRHDSPQMNRFDYRTDVGQSAVYCMNQLLTTHVITDADIMQLMNLSAMTYAPLYVAKTAGMQLQILTNALCQVRTMLPNMTANEALQHIVCIVYGFRVDREHPLFMYACAFARTILDDYRREN